MKDITVTSFTLAFNSVQDAGRDNAVVSNYRVFINDKRRDFEAQGGNMQTLLIDNLTPNTMYIVTATVTNNFGEQGDTSTAIRVITLKEGKSDGT